ncbi:Uncharacterized protein Rs2_50299 [Raphanus sativus]|nr:Uncharacterized protein Rs2_50299 [Raphanus sativus]
MQFLHKLPPPLGNSNARFLTSFTSKPNIISLRCLSPLSLDFPPKKTRHNPPSSLRQPPPVLNSLPRRLSHPCSWLLELLQEDGYWKRPILRYDSVPPSLLKVCYAYCMRN